MRHPGNILHGHIEWQCCIAMFRSDWQQLLENMEVIMVAETDSRSYRHQRAMRECNEQVCVYDRLRVD